ncbi:lysosomal phospholipase A and acyltransferase isoform X4 [Sagmatias obliquidens]|uniref:lysosomal phospholipase A and acyltransferase isoform X4 n=1 Tax=Sagmatias obliquidens TaxID=3371155 RepID=UPI000F44042A|nr:group XV phospholipase A2 isoform X4 [Lagenorhynchus obliquidens]
MTTLRCPCPTPLLASVHESRMNESEIRYAGGISEAPTANRTLGTWEKGTWSIEPARKLAESHPHFSPWKPATKAAGAPAAVPGDLGNQLEAKLDKPTVVHYLCSKRTESYFTLWLNLELLLPVIIDCWIDNIRLVYNRTSRTTQFPDGVDVRVPGFGKTFSLEFLDPSKSSVPISTPWWRALWAGATHEVRTSGGPPMTGAELQQQPQAWKDKYIHAFVALGPPWGGVAKTLRVLASGDNNRIPVIGPLKIREQQRSAVSTSWLLPYNYTWSPKKVFVHTPTANYTLQDYRRFFQDIGFEDGWLMRQDTEGLVEAMVPPGVRLHCLYGTGVPTPDSFYYESFPDRDPKICFGDGDGTVNLQSALQCQAWRGHQKQEVSLQALPGTEHIAMLANATTLAYLKRVLLGP